MYKFDDACLVGVKQIDEEHRQLFDLINEANDILVQKDQEVALAKPLLSQLKHYADTHFAHEEAYMESISDPELEAQREAHAQFRKQLEKVEEKLGGESTIEREVLIDLLVYLSKWLFRHILGSDILIGKFGKKEDAFAFTTKYLTGIEIVDTEHKRLFDIIRETNDVIHAELLHDKYDKILDILDELKEYTTVHFADEEHYMEQIGYEGLEAQKIAHEAFIEKLSSVDLEAVDQFQEAYLDELVQFLLEWLANHILRMDKMIPVC